MLYQSSLFILLTQFTSLKQTCLPFTLQSNTMKIVRKERIDVKKYMEDMKANKTATKRTFASVQERTNNHNDRLSKERLMNQYDNHSNNSMPQFSRPTYRNQSFHEGNSRPNLYNQFDIMSQTSHNYRQNYVSPPIMVPQVNPNMFYNQMPAYYGTSQFPHTQYMYPNVNNSNQINNYDYPQLNQVVSQMNTQPFGVVEMQERQNSNSKPHLVDQFITSVGQNKLGNTKSLQIIELRGQQSKKIQGRHQDMKKIEDNKMVIQPKQEEVVLNEIFSAHYKQKEKKQYTQKQAETVNQQKVVKKKRVYKRRQDKVKQEVIQPPQPAKQVPDEIKIAEDVNKQFEQMLQRERKAEAQKHQKETICQNILTLLDDKLRQSYTDIHWRDVAEQLEISIKKIQKSQANGKKSLKKYVSDTMCWLDNLKQELQLK